MHHPNSRRPETSPDNSAPPLHPQRHRLPTWLVLCCLVGLWLPAAFTLQGCRKRGPAEQAFNRLQQALEEGAYKKVWESLTHQSQQRFAQEAKKRGYQGDVKELFVSSAPSQNRRLRPEPKAPKHISANHVVLYYRDELDQPVQLTMRKEKGRWRLQLGPHFTDASAQPPPTTRPTTKPATRPTAKPNTRPAKPTTKP